MIKFLKFLTVPLCIFGITNVMAADEVRFVTEEFPPYNYTENGKLIGAGAEIVQEMIAKLGTSPKIEIMPWARAYNEAQTQANVMIFTMARTPKREALFKWIGVILPVTTSFYKYKANVKVQGADIAALKAFKVGGIKEQVATQWLEKNQFDINYSNGYSTNLKALRDQRIDLMLIDDLAFAYLLKQEKLSMDDFEKLISVDELKIDDCIGANLNTPDETVAKYSKALAEVRASAKFQEIVSKYSK